VLKSSKLLVNREEVQQQEKHSKPIIIFSNFKNNDLTPSKNKSQTVTKIEEESNSSTTPENVHEKNKGN
jgi:hypothetical protein